MQQHALGQLLLLAVPADNPSDEAGCASEWTPWHRGETHWLSNQVHPEYAQKQTTTHTEPELAQFSRNEGLNSNTSSVPAAMIGTGTFRMVGMD
jgi:hypothetical protein